MKNHFFHKCWICHLNRHFVFCMFNFVIKQKQVFKKRKAILKKEIQVGRKWLFGEFCGIFQCCFSAELLRLTAYVFIIYMKNNIK